MFLLSTHTIQPTKWYVRWDYVKGGCYVRWDYIHNPGGGYVRIAPRPMSACFVILDISHIPRAMRFQPMAFEYFGQRCCLQYYSVFGRILRDVQVGLQ